MTVGSSHLKILDRSRLAKLNPANMIAPTPGPAGPKAKRGCEKLISKSGNRRVKRPRNIKHRDQHGEPFHIPSILSIGYAAIRKKCKYATWGGLCRVFTGDIARYPTQLTSTIIRVCTQPTQLHVPITDTLVTLTFFHGDNKCICIDANQGKRDTMSRLA
jgi:hypothetical protein